MALAWQGTNKTAELQTLLRTGARSDCKHDFEKSKAKLPVLLKQLGTGFNPEYRINKKEWEMSVKNLNYFITARKLRTIWGYLEDPSNANIMTAVLPELRGIAEVAALTEAGFVTSELTYCASKWRGSQIKRCR